MADRRVKIRIKNKKIRKSSPSKKRARNNPQDPTTRATLAPDELPDQTWREELGRVNETLRRQDEDKANWRRWWDLP